MIYGPCYAANPSFNSTNIEKTCFVGCPLQLNGILARLRIRDGGVRSQMSETSPGTAGLLADDGDVTIGNESPAFVTRLDSCQSALMGR